MPNPLECVMLGIALANKEFKDQLTPEMFLDREIRDLLTCKDDKTRRAIWHNILKTIGVEAVAGKTTCERVVLSLRKMTERNRQAALFNEWVQAQKGAK